MSYITDRQHLLKVAESGIAAIEELAHAWLAEDQTACAPRASGGGGPISGGGTSDPVEAIASGRDPGPDWDGLPRPPVDTDKYRDRDRIGSQLLALVGKLSEMAEAQKPRHTGGPCACCGKETATHGRGHDGRPVECWACWAFRRKMGFRCEDDIHDERPSTSMCECPDWCCEVCPDRSAEGRRVSDRCAQRMSRKRRQQAS